jgi:calcineurin-like phosphoesterase family protein
MIYFTADQHYGHTGIIKFCDRPFKDVEDMNEGLVSIFNSIVTDKDEVYHLGDFAFNDPALWVARLNGRRHHLILGNHDYKRLNGIKNSSFSTVQDVLYLRYEGYRLFLSHYAHRVWRNSIHGSMHLYGHSHGNIPDFNRSMDVGVDRLGYKPISIVDVIGKLMLRPITDQHDMEVGRDALSCNI